MRAGRLDRRLTLYRPVEGDDGFATVDDGPGAVATVAASRRDVKAGEGFQASGVEAETWVVFEIRWSRTVAPIDTTWTVCCEGRFYNVTGVRELGRREGLEISAAERRTPCA